jgi:phosphoglycolate phosphatase
MNFSSPRPCRLFLFDLDGTLIDSRADITAALNLTLIRMSLSPLNESLVAAFVGNGVQKLVERALRETAGSQPEDFLIQQGIALFKDEYGNHLLDRTCLYPGVKEGLEHISWAGFAIVSNKPEKFSRHILDGLGLGGRFRPILGEDSTQTRKPDPTALLKAMDYHRASPSETVMVGDSVVDIEAGKAAGVITCGISGGFRPKEELEAAGCDLMIGNLLELARYFCPPRAL